MPARSAHSRGSIHLCTKRHTRSGGGRRSSIFCPRGSNGRSQPWRESAWPGGDCRALRTRSRAAPAAGAAGLSQVALAEVSGISRTVINRVESGARVPSVRTHARLRAALGLEAPAASLTPARLPVYARVPGVLRGASVVGAPGCEGRCPARTARQPSRPHGSPPRSLGWDMRSIQRSVTFPSASGRPFPCSTPSATRAEPWQSPREAAWPPSSPPPRVPLTGR
ncbi:MAG: helix-turn-helix transcriptional regulator [Chloroflexi bacterium]|nr:MAG: helix-turn-helix transcriptional regulator [Chloroflexota bacterium]